MLTSGKIYPSDMHAASCYLKGLAILYRGGSNDLIDLAALKERLAEQVRHCISSNIGEWETSYVCKPSQFFVNNSSIFYADNKEMA